ncbi:hypothetical protein FHG87_024876 [Trinorchestia longiramus]|nr:hypothetical protein FHG87_024876 [Trinorchestia longiramus]
MWCGLSPVSDFSDLLPDMDAETLQRIAAVYSKAISASDSASSENDSTAGVYKLGGASDIGATTSRRQTHRHVEDVDLYTGGLAELPVVGGAMGPTFACIVADQFLRLKLGDRFWYETDQLPQAFSSGGSREKINFIAIRYICMPMYVEFLIVNVDILRLVIVLPATVLVLLVT